MNTETGIFLWAFPFPERSAAAEIVEDVVQACAASGASGKRPLMGSHGTVLTPFVAPRHAMYLMAGVAESLWELWGQELKVEVQVTNVGLFPPPTPESDIEALYLELLMPPGYRKLVERMKMLLPYPYVHRPAQTTAVEPIWTPHISVIEGPGLGEKVRPIMRHLVRLIRYRSINLGPLRFFEKKTDGETKWWQPVVF